MVCLEIRWVLATWALSLLLPGWVGATATDMAPPAEGAASSWLPLGLQSYEANALGYTKNNDDVHFENFKLSVQLPIIPKRTAAWWGEQDRVYFSFTGLFAFYLGDRHSAPVVGQEYNPQLFWQHLWSCKDVDSDKYRAKSIYPTLSAPPDQGLDVSGASSATATSITPGSRSCYVTLGYNHDSNGQIIDSAEQFQQTEHQQGLAAAYDAVSRGWDYIAVNGKLIPYWGLQDKITLYPMVKYFLSDGLLQGNPEELHFWEHPPDGKPRRDVDGLTLVAKYQRRIGSLDSKLVVGYTTGYERTFKYNTLRIEAGAIILELPIVLWMQNGYMSDLSRYYQSVRGYGVQIEIGSF